LDFAMLDFLRLFRFVVAILCPFAGFPVRAKMPPRFLRLLGAELLRRFLPLLKTTFVFPEGLRFFFRRGFITVEPYPVMTFRAGFLVRGR
jgi:hypothetical protein